MRSSRVVLALVAVVGGCADGSVDLATALMEARSGAGLEQVLEAQVTAQNGVVRFSITSTLVNRSGQPLTLTVRSCYLRASDLRGDRAGLRLEEPLMLCASDGHRITLPPGESSEPLAIGGSMDAGSSHELEVRHALQPEHWEPVTLRAP